ncbi:MAG: hypothetical protein C3F07_17950 [Anaerolineales bacterium]|nr:LysM peptidoglycan-binding domain-containing protein [Anaerolineae bacterium]PWB70018.1 MAG: hypothetical protein C3F07_17950 [Anaerolineales bacterium]
MSRMQRGVMAASTLLLIAILTSACNQPYSQPPAVTNTPIDTTNFFATAITEPSSMQDVENFSTQTAQAALGTSVPVEVTATPTGIANILVTATITPTPIINLNPTTTATQAVAVSTSTSPSSGSSARPSTYILKKGEFPFCIARRYNVDPDTLLRLSGLSAGILYPPGTVLTIPQTGSFPDNRMLRNHPTTYSVASSDQTIYGVACEFGDIEPSAIASANNLSVDAKLTVGQQLNIP